MLNLDELRQAVRHEGGVSRRLFLAYGAALSALPWVSGRTEDAVRRVSFDGEPFSLGVASGDPDDTSVVLWTRLAPRPLEPDGGMKATPVEVGWEVAEDEAMKKVVRKGNAVATPQLGHAVHVEAGGLKPDRWYWYRFRAGDARSPVGRTRTLPAPFAQPERLRLAIASCQHYEQGLFTAYGQMARDDVDLVFHLGDYIYEYAGADGKVRKHLGKEIESLGDYRVRYSQYRADPLLHGMHAVCPWFVTWDDHEFDNNYANAVSEEKGIDPVAFLTRRASAYQAYYEVMPLRPRSLPRGPHLRLYRKASFGRLAEFLVLDTRQYRTRPAQRRPAVGVERGGPGPQEHPARGQAEALAPGIPVALAGDVERAGPAGDDGHGGPGARGRGAPEVLDGQVVWLCPRADGTDALPGRAPRAQSGGADGRHPLQLVNDLRIDDRQTDTPVVATEFVGTSISSGGNGSAKPGHLEPLLRANPCVRFHNTERGYVRSTVTPKEWRSDYVAVEDVLKPGGKVVGRASFVAEAGRPGAKPA